MAGQPRMAIQSSSVGPILISSAVADALDGYRWLHETGYGAGDIVVAGDSAGGYLAFMTALSVAAAGLPKPAGVRRQRMPVW